MFVFRLNEIFCVLLFIGFCAASKSRSCKLCKETNRTLTTPYETLRLLKSEIENHMSEYELEGLLLDDERLTIAEESWIEYCEDFCLSSNRKIHDMTKPPAGSSRSSAAGAAAGRRKRSASAGAASRVGSRRSAAGAAASKSAGRSAASSAASGRSAASGAASGGRGGSTAGAAASKSAATGAASGRSAASGAAFG